MANWLYLSLWRRELSTDADGVKVLTIFMGCASRCICNWHEDRYWESPNAICRLFSVVGSMRQPGDPPAVDILCHLFPKHREQIHATDLMLLDQRFKELL